MRYDIRNMNIWREDPGRTQVRHSADEFGRMKIEDLNLSVRAFNSLKRGDCHTVADILAAMDENGEGLRKFRNLGVRCEKEIKEKLGEAYREYAAGSSGRRAGIAPDDIRRGNQEFTPEQTGVPAGGAEDIRSGDRGDPGVRIVLRPARNLWTREIGEFHLSDYAEGRLRSCGVSRVGDLYATHPKSEPGWYAVRELFRKIAEYG